MNPHVRLVGLLINGRSFCHNFLKVGKLHFHAQIGALVSYTNGSHLVSSGGHLVSSGGGHLDQKRSETTQLNQFIHNKLDAR